MSEIIYSENAEDDIWEQLLKFSYQSNISKHIGGEVESEITNIVAGSITQAFEYFKSYKDVSLNTSPLLLYYGTINLLYGFITLKRNSIIIIKNHGAKLDTSEKQTLTRVRQL